MLANTQPPSNGETAVALTQFGGGGRLLCFMIRRSPRPTPCTTSSSCRWPTRQASNDCISTRTGTWLRAAGGYCGEHSDVRSIPEHLDICSVRPTHCWDVVNLGWPPRPHDHLALIIAQDGCWRRDMDNMTKATLETIQNATGISDKKYIKVSAEKPMSSNSYESLLIVLVGHQRYQRTTKTRRRKQPFTTRAPAQLPVAPVWGPTAKQSQRRKP